MRLCAGQRLRPPGLPLRGPKSRHTSASGRRPAVVHGTLSEINRFVFASSAESLKAAELELAGCDGVIGGHSGLPFTEVIGGRLWHNAGVIGRPANDGTRRTWYSILTRTRAGDAIEIEHCALTYGYRAAQNDMLQARLPPEYREALDTGLRPSLDVLPEAQLRFTGRALEPGAAL